MKYFSLFSGIGGFELGIERACGLRPDEQIISPRPNKSNGTSHKLERWECVGYSEINKWACAIYRHHFPQHKNYGDATTIRAMDLPDFNVLVAGFPCPSFSSAGKGQGFQDPRGRLFFDIVRILADKRPRYFLLENVQGLLGNKDGETFQKILETLADLGYLLQWEVLNSLNYSVPQDRKRVFIIGCLGSGRGQFVFSADGIGCSITNSGGGRASTGLYEIPLKANCLTPDGYLSRGERERVDGKAVLTSMWKRRIRRLMPIEAERLQSFPDNWTQFGVDEEGKKIHISDTQRYFALGNALTVNVVEVIVRELRRRISDGRRDDKAIRK